MLKCQDTLFLAIHKYTQNDLIDKDKFNDKLLCGICLDILNSPQRCKQCKQEYCTDCIKKQIKYSNRCPQRCQTNGEWVLEKSSKETNKMLEDIKVLCKEPNCNVKIKLNAFMKHYKNDCKQVFVYCPNLACTFQTRKVEMDAHLKCCDLNQKNYSFNQLKANKKPLTIEQEDNLLAQFASINDQKSYMRALEKGYEYGLLMQQKYGKYFETLPNLIYQIGVIYFNLNQFLPALANLLRFEEFQESKMVNKNKKENINHYTDVLFTIGYLYEELSQYSKAASYYERSLKQDLSYHLSQDMSVLINLGHAYRLIGNYQKSYDYCIWAIKVFDSELIQGEQNNTAQEDIWKVYHNLTYTLYKYGDIKQSQKTYEKLESISKEIHVKDCNQFSETLLLKSQIDQEMGQYKNALQIIKKTIDLRVKQLPPAHNDIVYSKRKQVQFFAKQSQFQQAHNVLDEQIEFLQKYSNQNNIKDLKNWKFNLMQYEKAKVLYRQKKYEEAQLVADKYCEQLLQISEVQCMHSRILQCLGRIYFKNNKNFQAIDYLNRSKELIISTFGEQSFKHAKILIFMGQFNTKQECYQVALRYYEQAFKIGENLLIKNHPLLIKILYKIIKVYQKMGNKQDELVNSIQRCQEIYQLAVDKKQLNIEKINKKVNQIQETLQEEEQKKKISNLSQRKNKRKSTINVSQLEDSILQDQQEPKIENKKRRGNQIQKQKLQNQKQTVQKQKQKKQQKKNQKLQVKIEEQEIENQQIMTRSRQSKKH